MLSRIERLRGTRLDSAMLVANISGVLLYLYRASFAWMIPSEREMGVQPSGEPFVWAAGVIPVWAAFLIANVIWAVIAVVRKQRVSALPMLVNACLWIVAVVIDFSRH
jgi:hypothetical protein